MPDIGDFKDVPVIEIFVKVGDTVKAEDPLVSLESDKATMDVPAPLSGRGEGDARQGRRQGQRRQHHPGAGDWGRAGCRGGRSRRCVCADAGQPPHRQRQRPCGSDEAAFALAYAGPAVRKLARELGVDLGKVKGSGAHGRIVRDDVEAFAKGGGTAAPAAPAGKAAAAPSAGGAAAGPAALAEGGLREVRSRSSARSCRASRRSRPPTCTATGSSSRTSPRTTRPTSPSSNSSACR